MSDEERIDELEEVEFDEEPPAVAPSNGRHDIAQRFEAETKDVLHQEWGIFESRYNAVLSLRNDAPKMEAKRAVIKVKRAAMDLRDTLKELGQFKI